MAERIRNKLTKEDFENFKGFVVQWMNFFGLHNWEVGFSFKEDPETFAYIEYNILDRTIMVCLSSDWGSVSVTDVKLDKTAFHEVCEILFVELRHLAGERFISPDEITKEIHSVIRTLENTIWKRIKTKGKVHRAMGMLKEAMGKDPDYARGWHCNIACMAQDAGVSHEISNQAASRFMKLAFNVETSDIMGRPETANRRTEK